MTYKNKTVTKHCRGNWFVRIRHNGKYISIYGRTKIEAYEKLKLIADEVERQKFARLLAKAAAPEFIGKPSATIQSESKIKSYTLQEWFDEWLNGYKVGSVRATTLDGFRKQFKYLKSLYAVSITDITNLMLSKALNEVAALRQKDGLHNMIKQMFAVAFNNRLIESNPALTLPRPKQFAKNEKRAFTQEQESRFIKLCMQDLDTYAPFLVCLLQGVRRGEMLALRPNDFDFENNILRIDESYDNHHPEDLQTKNEASNRRMPMFEMTKQILLRYMGYPSNERIFTLSDNGLNKRLAKFYDANPDLPRLTIHELRHTFISRCHEKKIDEIIVQKWVGHAIGSRMTKAVYTHVADDAERRYIELLNEKYA